MEDQLIIISLPLPFRMGSVNCYLVEINGGFILIDTGGTNNRKELMDALRIAGCKSGSLTLIVLTHGDFDHTGNAAYLRKEFGAKLAMHPDDAGMVQRGDIFASRKRPNLLVRSLIPLFSRFGEAERFTPDVLLSEGEDLSQYGIEARVISIPGHSKGSIGILTAGEDLFCGDLLENIQEPVIGSLIDDLAAVRSSVEKLKSMHIGTVYPGHGKPFPMQCLKGEGV